MTWIDEVDEVTQADYERIKAAIGRSHLGFAIPTWSTPPQHNWFSRFLGGPSDEPLWSLTPGSADEEETLP